MRTPTRNPFQHPDNPVQPGDGGSEGGLEVTAIEQVERVDQPWGHEEIFALVEGRYVGKLLHINAGRALPLQRHQTTIVTISVQSGRIRVEHGPDAQHLEILTLGPGERLLIRTGVVHRITALSTTRTLAVSTAQPGWRQDAVHIQDPNSR